jgi:hypothetical protein
MKQAFDPEEKFHSPISSPLSPVSRLTSQVSSLKSQVSLRLRRLSEAYPGKALYHILWVGKAGVARRVAAGYVEVREACVLVYIDTAGKVKAYRGSGKAHLIGNGFLQALVRYVGAGGRAGGDARARHGLLAVEREDAAVDGAAAFGVVHRAVEGGHDPRRFAHDLQGLSVLIVDDSSTAREILSSADVMAPIRGCCREITQPCQELSAGSG